VVSSSVRMSRWRIEHFFTVMQAEKVYYHSDLLFVALLNRFILGFFVLSIPWYVGTFIFFCLRYDPREYAGLAACAIAAVVVFLLGGSTMANQALF
jgi:signal transduction histidine kinase